MARLFRTKIRGVTLVGLAALAVVGAAQGVTGAQQQTPQEDSETMTILHSRGRSVWPTYEGWHPNPDGTTDLYFGYLNENWHEQLDIPLGPNNIVEGAYAPPGGDAGQPSHFLPRVNHYVFAVRVPKSFGEKDEVVWSLTSRGRTLKAYATLKPAYLRDDWGLMREYFGEAPMTGNKAPEVTLAGSDRRTARVGEAAPIDLTVIDDRVPFRKKGCGADASQFILDRDGSKLCTTLTVACFLYRGDQTSDRTAQELGDLGQASLVSFDPPQDHIWEDRRGGTRFAIGFQFHPLPPDNKWHVATTFKEPGSYTVRCQAFDGLLGTNKNITFSVGR